MVDGLTREQIARRLGMSPHTVRTHVQSLLHKLGVHSSLRAVAIARQAGLVTQGDSVPHQRAAP
jgi:DNA-binding CsgD family transcriptional regulator